MTFLACPLQPGMYALKCAHVRLGALSLHVPASTTPHQPPSLEQEAMSVGSLHEARPASAPSADAAPILASASRPLDTSGGGHSLWNNPMVHGVIALPGVSPVGGVVLRVCVGHARS